MDNLTLERIKNDLSHWTASKRRKDQLNGERYYDGIQDILTREREVIGRNGEIETVDNLPNNRIVDNQYKKLIKQKTNYIAGRPLTISGKDKRYVEALKTIFDKRFMRTFKNAVKNSMETGICWMFPYFDSTGALRFKLISGSQLMPYWADDEHTEVTRGVRLFEQKVYETATSTTPRIITKCEIYDADGIYSFTYRENSLIPDNGGDNLIPYAVAADSGKGYNWNRVPLIPVKYNEDETPLINMVKCLQDGLNVLISDFENNMQEDCRNTIMVLKNFDGENLGEFRKNLATFGAVKVRSGDGGDAGVETLQITVNSDNYKAILDLFKKSIIENGMGYDAKDDRLSGTPNQLNIRSMYSDIDLDANDMEVELQAALQDMLWFVDSYLMSIGAGSYFDTPVDFIFNRDILINESQVISDIRSSEGILSRKTLVEQHPYVDDVEEEMRRIAQEEQEEQKKLGYDPFDTDDDDKGGDDGE